MVGNIVLSAAQRSTLAAIGNAQRSVDSVTARLASGLRVDSAIDDPQNFFTAQGLRNRASDFNRLLDGIGQNIRTVEAAISGVEATSQLLDQAESIVIESRTTLASGGPNSTSGGTLNTTPLSEQILADDPVAYYRLNDLSGPAQNLGTVGTPINGRFEGGTLRGQEPLFDNGADFSAGFDGGDDRIAISDTPFINTAAQSERTVEIVFNADTVSGRQVIFEEGNADDGFAIYIDDGNLFITAEDDGNFADVNFNTPINAEETYHVAFVFDQPSNSFTGFLNGQSIGSIPVNNQIFPAHNGNIGVGGSLDGVQFHDGEDSGISGFGFNGRLSDLAIYNTALDAQSILDRANSVGVDTSARSSDADFNAVLDQIDQIALDSQFRGINLLNGDTLLSVFNEDGTSQLITEGVTFTSNGFGIERFDFNNSNDLDSILTRIRSAQDAVAAFSASLSTDLSLIQIRQDFTRNLINTHEAGADDLTLADANLEGANQLANQTRLALGVTALSLATQSQQSVLRLF